MVDGIKKSYNGSVASFCPSPLGVISGPTDHPELSPVPSGHLPNEDATNPINSQIRNSGP